MSTALKLERGRVPMPPPNKGRILHVEDIQALGGTKPDGTPRWTRWWITHEFAPSLKRKTGRSCWWWEYEALAWLDQQMAPDAGDER
jgi:hypothetical protein